MHQGKKIAHTLGVRGKKMMKNLDIIYRSAGVQTKGDGTDLQPNEEDMLYSQLSIEIETNHKNFLKLLKPKQLKTTQAYQKLNLSSRKCDRLKSDLVAQGLVEVEEVKDNKGRSKVLRITEKGLTLLKFTGKRG